MTNLPFYPSCFIAGLCMLLLACGAEAEEINKKRKTRKQRDALSLIRNDDCLGCHSIEDKTIGPAYKQIAERYDADSETVDQLADKVMEGGGGLWGGAQMSKHPFLKERDAKTIVKWILSLDGPKVKQASGDISYSLSELENTSKGKGLRVDAYTPDELGSFPSSGFPKPGNAKPALSVTAPQALFRNTAAFSPLQAPFYVKITGQMTIEKRGIYFFKIEKGGRAMLKWEGLQVISDRKDDHEINLKLEAGTYPIEIDYLSSGTEHSLGLLWIPPGELYFQPVPELVFTSP